MMQEGKGLHGFVLCETQIGCCITRCGHLGVLIIGQCEGLVLMIHFQCSISIIGACGLGHSIDVYLFVVDFNSSRKNHKQSYQIN